MDDVETVNIVKGCHDLPGNLLHPMKCKILRLLAPHVHFVGLVQVVFEKLRNNYKVLFVVKVVEETQNTFFVNITIVIYVFEQLNFVNGLVDVVLVIRDNLHAVKLAIFEVEHLDSL